MAKQEMTPESRGSRPKVLMLAFACEPDFGSEPEVGWRWALEMSRYVDVTVVTDEGHRAAIEKKLPTLKDQPVPKFHFFGPGPAGSRLFRYFGYRGYYRKWMRDVRPLIAQLHKSDRFDLMHHVTYAGCRFNTAVWGHGVPVVWGPVGGLEPMPLDVIPWSQPKTALFEVARNIGNQLALGHLRRGGQQSAVVLASTRETQDAFHRAGVAADLMATIGIETEALGEARSAPRSGPLRLVFAGRLLALKGISLAIQAVGQVPGSKLTIIGDGPFGPSSRSLVGKLRLEKQVEFRPPMPRPDLIREYTNHDALIYPSFHDSGGFVVLEAMARGLPVICADCGGPGIAVQAGCGVKVPLTKRSAMVDALAAAIRRYEANRDLVLEEGQNARRSVEENYLWARKAQKMAAIYEAAGRVQTAT
jgi:glycosyltransferase involved in cell wall biosynthesis